MLQNIKQSDTPIALNESEIWLALEAGEPIDEQTFEGILNFYGYHYEVEEVTRKGKKVMEKKNSGAYKKPKTRELKGVFNRLEGQNLSGILMHFIKKGDLEGAKMFYGLLEDSKKIELFEIVLDGSLISSVRGRIKHAVTGNHANLDSVKRALSSHDYKPALDFLAKNPQKIRNFIFKELNDNDVALELLVEAVKKHNFH